MDEIEWKKRLELLKTTIEKHIDTISNKELTLESVNGSHKGRGWAGAPVPRQGASNGARSCNRATI